MSTESVTTNPYFAALAGALLGLKAVPGMTPLQFAANLALGALTAAFIGPALVEWLHISSPKIAAGVIFAVGAAGLVAFVAIMEGVKQTPFGAIISSWLPRGRNKEGS